MTTNTLSQEDTYQILNAINHLGPITFNRLKDYFQGDPRKVLEASLSELKKVEGVGTRLASAITTWNESYDLNKEKQYLKKLNVRFIPRFHDEYPPLLKEIYDPPIGLYTRGKKLSTQRTIGIIGSRRCSLYGQKIANTLAKEFVKLGFCVVSGLARGIDSSAHKGALEEGGPTIAVLGCGVNIIYPPENKDLYEAIKENGAIVSEYCLNRRADKMTFPMRNRIISGISQALIVVETNTNGGSIITAKLAADQGRHVFAVPGRIDQETSRGCHKLIREGASLCTCIGDILEELQYLKQTELPLMQEVKIPEDLEDNQKNILKVLHQKGPQNQDFLSESLNLPITLITSSLLILELKGFITKKMNGLFEFRY